MSSFTELRVELTIGGRSLRRLEADRKFGERSHGAGKRVEVLLMSSSGLGCGSDACWKVPRSWKAGRGAADGLFGVRMWFRRLSEGSTELESWLTTRQRSLRRLETVLIPDGRFHGADKAGRCVFDALFGVRISHGYLWNGSTGLKNGLRCC